jgi:hypothetical protein
MKLARAAFRGVLSRVAEVDIDSPSVEVALGLKLLSGGPVRCWEP